MVLLFKGIAPPSRFPATIASGAPPRPNHAVFKAELVYVSKPFGGTWGGGLHHVHYVFFQKKKRLFAHYVPTACAHTTVVHRVQERVACPSWGAPPWGPETWVIEVIELKGVKEGGLIALVRGTIKVVLLFAGHIACRTGSFFCGLKQSVPPLAIFGPLPGGLQWPCPTIPLCSGLRFGRWHCWGMRCCGLCGVGGGGGGGAIVSGGIVGERCRGRSRRVSHFLLLCTVLQGTNVLRVAEALLYPLGYGPSLTYLYTGVVLIFGPNWFSSIVGFS